jgi:hypothetical protein
MHWMFALLLAAAPPEAKAKAEKEDLGRQKVSVTALAASGATLGPSDSKTGVMRSPAMLLVDAGFFHPEHQWLEFSPAVMAVLEGRQLFGLGFRMRAFTSLWRLQVYAIGGIEAFVAPRKLLGARLGAGAALPLHRRFALTVEGGPTMYFAGGNLQDGAVGTKLDAGVGIRVNF